MLLSYGAFLFLRLIIPGLTAGDSIDDFSFRGASFFALNYPSRWRGRYSKCCFPTGLSFFVFNYLWPVGADKINIPRCRGG